MNKKQRESNKRNSKVLYEAARYARLQKHICENCGEPGRHWLQWPHSIMDIMNNREPQGFWTCDKYYDKTGRRINE